jgi:hypothetical protein
MSMLDNTFETLKTSLTDWQDWDFAAYDLALCLGLMSPETSFTTKAKHVFWSVHPIGSFLYDMLDKMVELGILEMRDEPDLQYRWNKNFKGTWEK